MSEEEEVVVVEEEGIHYVEKTLFYWFSVREMANVLRDNLASIKTPCCPLSLRKVHEVKHKTDKKGDHPATAAS
ncbi:hypothetical protein Q8A67_025519 [Cirrhinus molitorella]|uniref:Uncharacterized protein n=1 Tax=Cirrhinus molitorella TaxID=172907 RepID=A0AA88T8C3_9TELE|nr:hypothetical protein Q8A67_025519 [Cirrhinus molitorella]